MSYVSTVVVLVSYYEPHKNIGNACEAGWSPDREFDKLECLSCFPEGHSRGVDTAIAWGGSKVPESDVLGGAFNHLNLGRLREHLAATLTEPYLLCHSTEGQDERWKVESYPTS